MEPSDKQAVVTTFAPHELNQALVCILCFGYFRSAHTVKECMHSFCKSCIYKHFNDSMECPQCGKDLQPMPFTMIRPDPVLQSIVDKLFPDVVAADYVAEEEFYLKRKLPLPDHLVERKRRKAKEEAKAALVAGLPVGGLLPGQSGLDVSISMSELDSSYMAPSEADSELLSEIASVDASLLLPDVPVPTSTEPNTEIPLDIPAETPAPPAPSAMDVSTPEPAPEQEPSNTNAMQQ